MKICIKCNEEKELSDSKIKPLYKFTTTLFIHE